VRRETLLRPPTRSLPLSRDHPVAEIGPARRRTGADLQVALSGIPAPDDRFAEDIAAAVSLLEADRGDPWADA
jgi:hypothetical protein